MVDNCVDESLNLGKREMFLFKFGLFWPPRRCQKNPSRLREKPEGQRNHHDKCT